LNGVSRIADYPSNDAAANRNPDFVSWLDWGCPRVLSAKPRVDEGGSVAWQSELTELRREPVKTLAIHNIRLIEQAAIGRTRRVSGRLCSRSSTLQTKANRERQ
jgi:hypothetical protein